MAGELEGHELINAWLRAHQLTAERFEQNEDGELVAVMPGRWRVLEDDEAAGVNEGDEGTLEASMVGAPELGNHRIWYGLRIDGMTDPVEVQPDALEQV